MQVQITPTPDQDTAAAIAAAIACSSMHDRGCDTPDAPARSSWGAAGVLAAQGLPPARNGAHAAWHAAERARRTERWSYGVVGM